MNPKLDNILDIGEVMKILHIYKIVFGTIQVIKLSSSFSLNILLSIHLQSRGVSVF